jgi:hypothetical protein
MPSRVRSARCSARLTRDARRPVDQRQVELVAHHPALAQLGLVGLRQVACKTRCLRVLQPVADDAPQPVHPHRPLAAGQVAQQAAQGLVPLVDQTSSAHSKGTPASRHTRR